MPTVFLIFFIGDDISASPFSFQPYSEKKAEPVAGTFSMDFSSIPVTRIFGKQPRVEIPWMHI
jgi:hypothetical protein